MVIDVAVRAVTEHESAANPLVHAGSARAWWWPRGAAAPAGVAAAIVAHKRIPAIAAAVRAIAPCLTGVPSRQVPDVRGAGIFTHAPTCAGAAGSAVRGGRRVGGHDGLHVGVELDPGPTRRERDDVPARVPEDRGARERAVRPRALGHPAVAEDVGSARAVGDLGLRLEAALEVLEPRSVGDEIGRA